MSVEQSVLTNCRLTDELADGAAPGDDGVWLRDGTVAAVGPADDLLAEARAAGAVTVADLDGAHVLPGLIDMHTHFGVVHPGTTDEARLRGESEAALALRMAACAGAAVRAGVTTVRLVSERRHADFALRAAIGRGEVTGPRIFTAGRALTATGGHGLGSHAVEADGVAAFRRQARDQIKQGADLVKVMVSGGVSDEGEGLNSMQMTTDELRAAVDVAHAWGRPVAGHLGGADVVDAAIDCGVDSVEHGYALTEPVARKMADRGVWLVPTMMVTRGREYFSRIEAPGWLIDRLEAAAPRHVSSVATARRSGVRILAGTDFLPAERFDDTSAMVRELESLTEAGLEAIDALRAATTLAAECLGAGDRLGRIAAGAHADVVAVDGDPRADIGALRRLRLVVAAGRVVRRDDRVRLEAVRHGG